MRFLSTRVHGVLDYLVGILLLLSPYLVNLPSGPARWVPMLLGAAAIIYSLLTRYEFGAIRVLPMPLHLWLDGLSGAFLAISPWLLGFADEVFWPHLLIGLFEIGASLTTRTSPSRDVPVAA